MASARDIVERLQRVGDHLGAIAEAVRTKGFDEDALELIATAACYVKVKLEDLFEAIRRR